MMESEVDPSRVMGICIDTTCCSVVALDANGNALRPCLLWYTIRMLSSVIDLFQQLNSNAIL